MNPLLWNTKSQTMTSLELLGVINGYRRQFGYKSILQHKNLLRSIRNEFEEEIANNELKQTYFIDSMNRKQPIFNLTHNQCLELLLLESSHVRRIVLKHLDELENRVPEHKRQQSFFDVLMEFANDVKAKEEAKPKQTRPVQLELF